MMSRMGEVNVTLVDLKTCCEIWEKWLVKRYSRSFDSETWWRSLSFLREKAESAKRRYKDILGLGNRLNHLAHEDSHHCLSEAAWADQVVKVTQILQWVRSLASY